MAFIPIQDENHHDTFPWLCILVIALCCLAFGFQCMLAEEAVLRFYDAFATIPVQLFGEVDGTNALPEWATLFTSAFLHGDVIHLFGNMLFLWLFADNIEHAFGRFRFAVFYLLSAAITAWGAAAINPTQAIPSIGASGAISAIIGAYFVLYPRAQVTVFYAWNIYMWGTTEIQAWNIMLFWFTLDIIGFAFTDRSLGGVSYEAHIIGFVLGVIFGRALRINYSSYDEIWDGMTRIQRKIRTRRQELFGDDF
jgi:membrane associated rhomboid family serine protease